MFSTFPQRRFAEPVCPIDRQHAQHEPGHSHKAGHGTESLHTYRSRCLATAGQHEGREVAHAGDADGVWLGRTLTAFCAIRQIAGQRLAPSAVPVINFDCITTLPGGDISGGEVEGERHAAARRVARRDVEAAFECLTGDGGAILIAVDLCCRPAQVLRAGIKR